MFLIHMFPRMKPRDCSILRSDFDVLVLGYSACNSVWNSVFLASPRQFLGFVLGREAAMMSLRGTPASDGFHDFMGVNDQNMNLILFKQGNREFRRSGIVQAS